MRQLIKNAWIIDGTGSDAFKGEILLENRTILEIASRIDVNDSHVIDAQEGMVTPGFIDVHSHTDLATFIPDGFRPKVLQGITTELIGLCGLGVAPLPEAQQAEARKRLIIGHSEIEWRWESYGEYCSALEAQGLEVNLSAFVPHGLLRFGICQDSPAIMNQAQLKQLDDLADKALSEGARGISLGLIYHPALFSNREELLTMARVAASHNKPVVVHLRSESDEVLEALEEMIGISETAGGQLHISHLKLIGRRNGHKLNALLDLIDRHQLTFDQYPYGYGSTTLLSILPPELIRSYQPDQLFLMLQKESVRREVKAWFSEQILPEKGVPWDNLPALVGWDNILIVDVETQASRQWLGLSISDCARHTGQHPVDFTLDLLITEQGNVRMIDFFMDEALVERIFQHPRGVVGTDSLLGGRLHPRVSGTFPRILNQFVQKRQLMPIEQAIYKMTGQSADIFSIENRGRLAKGYRADIALFRPDFRDHATVAEPEQPATGLDMLWVNGQCKVSAGVYQANRPGELLYCR